ncbi:HAD family hydrolase [Roseisolibacter sp. H3M3-2]|uniref:HAD family hydrolase n=1 Tax=Roseisolibacter sp. H3M3-2 TaxID=3031323 RepID=UPI0023DBDE58|nr:HAD family hydrolase [Roseisolibacter sp. H3M3-2]MDF1501707.1 HAD family hydrolase [Roseisolibacter sp. H3M3-2]
MTPHTNGGPAGAVRLIFIDVDGTLVGADGTVHPRVWAALAPLHAAGVHVATCTGRPGFGVTRALAERLDPAGWHVFQNGASVSRLDGGATRSAGLSPETVRALLAQARATGRTLELYADASYAAVQGPADPYAGRAARHAELIGAPHDARGPEAFAAAERVVRGQWMVAHDELPAVLADPPPNGRLVPSGSPMMPETTFVSVVDPAIDKVTGVRAVAEAYGVPLSAVMFVGDGGNDARAMRAVREAGGWALAPANGEPEALEEAQQVVGHVEEGGLADALALAMETVTPGETHA